MKKQSLNLLKLSRVMGSSLFHNLGCPIKRHQIREKYEFPEGRRASESIKEYCSRVFKNSTEYQFIKIKVGKSFAYVAFGVPGPIITKYGKFLIVPAEVVNGRWGIHHLLIYPDLKNLLIKREILLRIESGCMSGTIFGDTTCDCRQQHELALKKIVREGAGVIVNIPEQDGRGWPQFKMANQQLIDELNIDTMSAAKYFYKDTNLCDIRTFDEVALILKAIGFNQNHYFDLLSKNKNKVKGLTRNSLNVLGSRALTIYKLNPKAKKNLHSKALNISIYRNL